MKKPCEGPTIAIVGCGPTALFLLNHLFNNIEHFRRLIGSISIFEKRSRFGSGMPYDPQETDPFNLSNISSVEIPDLGLSLYDWLMEQPDDLLESFQLSREALSKDILVARALLGLYFEDRYKSITESLSISGLSIENHLSCKVTDIRDDLAGSTIQVITEATGSQSFDLVILATGHLWPRDNQNERSLFQSPWPMRKILDALAERKENSPLRIGLLGTSLSAMDVVTSIAHRLGAFRSTSNGLKYEAYASSGSFKIFMHSGHGWFPHLQYEQTFDSRDPARYLTPEIACALMDNQGFLRLSTVFNAIARPVLIDAFRKDHRHDLAEALATEQVDLIQIISTLTKEHADPSAFNRLGTDLQEALEMQRKGCQAHWKEAFDDIVYGINEHAYRLPAEDHQLLRKTVLPFLMNVIAALPLGSARILLALHEAGYLQVVEGRIGEVSRSSGFVEAEIRQGNEQRVAFRYDLFVDCSGQSPVSLDAYPFPCLKKKGRIRAARVPFADTPEDTARSDVVHEGNRWCCELPGIDVDPFFRIIDRAGHPNPRLFDISYSHIMGKRPYGYGLPACSQNAERLSTHLMELLSQESGSACSA